MATDLSKGVARSQDKMTVRTPKARALYAFVFRARPSMNAKQGNKFSITLAFKKGKVSIGALKRAAKEAAAKKFGEKAREWDLAKLGIKDGDDTRDNTSNDPNFHGCWTITAKTGEDQPPGIVGPDKEPITNQTDFYSGCMCVATVRAYPYDVNGNKGVGWLLNNVMKIADGKRLSGKPNADQDFDDVEAEDREDDDDEAPRSRRRDDDEDEAPRRRRREDDDEAPRRRRRDDDEEEAPRRRRRRDDDDDIPF